MGSQAPTRTSDIFPITTAAKPPAEASRMPNRQVIVPPHMQPTANLKVIQDPHAQFIA